MDVEDGKRRAIIGKIRISSKFRIVRLEGALNLFTRKMISNL